MSPLLERVLEIVTVLGLLVMAVTLVDENRRTPPQKPSQGSTLPQLPGVSFRERAFTVIAAVSSRCVHCVDSLPFYRRLGERIARNSKSLQFVLAVNADASEEKAFWEAAITSKVTVATLPAASGIAVVPTVVIVDSTGRVLTSVAGRLPDDTEKRLLQVVNDLVRSMEVRR